MPTFFSIFPDRSLTPASTAATIATSDEGGGFGNSNSNESDTYEPIEAFQDLFAKPENPDEESKKHQVIFCSWSLFIHES